MVEFLTSKVLAGELVPIPVLPEELTVTLSELEVLIAIVFADGEYTLAVADMNGLVIRLNGIIDYPCVVIMKFTTYLCDLEFMFLCRIQLYDIVDKFDGLIFIRKVTDDSLCRIF